MRRLTPQEIAGYDLVSADLARRARVQKVPLLAPGTHGMTVGRLILVLRDDDRSGRRALLAHELVHVEQYAELGIIRFLRRYVGSTSSTSGGCAVTGRPTRPSHSRPRPGPPPPAGGANFCKKSTAQVDS